MAITRPYQSARLRRVREVTHGLTLDLFLQVGDFWKAIDEFRRCCLPDGLAVRAVPPRLEHPPFPDGHLFHQPPRLPEGRTAEPGHYRTERMWWFCATWHDRFGDVPDAFIEAFLTGCLVYDPPDTDLIAFADHADHLLGGRLAVSAGAAAPPPGLPVGWLPDVDRRPGGYYRRDSLIACDEFVRAIAACRATADDSGVPGPGRPSECEGDWSGQCHHCAAHVVPGSSMPSERPRRIPVITVHPDTSLSDVREAYRWIREREPASQQATKPPKDILLCVQCAIWRDRYDRSEVEIGKRFGWTIQYPEDAKPRCETARQYIADGRALLTQ